MKTRSRLGAIIPKTIPLYEENKIKEASKRKSTRMQTSKKKQIINHLKNSKSKADQAKMHEPYHLTDETK